jgi:hypothetical protein
MVGQDARPVAHFHMQIHIHIRIDPSWIQLGQDGLGVDLNSQDLDRDQAIQISSLEPAFQV